MSKIERITPPRFIRKYIFGLSQVEFAREIGVAQPTIVRWEADGFIASKHQDIGHIITPREKVGAMKAVAMLRRVASQLEDAIEAASKVVR